MGGWGTGDFLMFWYLSWKDFLKLKWQFFFLLKFLSDFDAAVKKTKLVQGFVIDLYYGYQYMCEMPYAMHLFLGYYWKYFIKFNVWEKQKDCGEALHDDTLKLEWSKRYSNIAMLSHM